MKDIESHLFFFLTPFAESQGSLPRTWIQSILALYATELKKVRERSTIFADGSDGGRWHTVVEEKKIRKFWTQLPPWLFSKKDCTCRRKESSAPFWAWADWINITLAKMLHQVDNCGAALWENRQEDHAGEHNPFCDMVRGSQASQEQSLSPKSVTIC